jgi:hypothetical protein
MTREGHRKEGCSLERSAAMERGLNKKAIHGWLFLMDGFECEDLTLRINLDMPY